MQDTKTIIDMARLVCGSHFYLAGSERHFPATSCTTSHRAVVAEVADAVGKLGLQADLAGGVQLNPGLLLKLSLLTNLGFQSNDLILFLSATQREILLDVRYFLLVPGADWVVRRPFLML